jgi:hypothetical protein
MLFEVFPVQYTACDRGTKFFLFRDVQSHHGSIVVPPFWTTMNEETLTIVVWLLSVSGAIDQERRGGARGCPADQAKSGLGEWKNSDGRTGAPDGMGKAIAIEGGRPTGPAWVRQNRQCSRPIASVCAPDAFPVDASTIWSLVPSTEQISAMIPILLCPEPDTACDIPGSNDASKIAKHAIHAVMRFWVF